MNNLIINDNLSQGGQGDLQSAALLTQKTREFKIGTMGNMNNLASKYNNDGSVAEQYNIFLNDKKAR